MKPSPLRRLLGVDFFVGSLETAVEWAVGHTETTMAASPVASAVVHYEATVANPVGNGGMAAVASSGRSREPDAALSYGAGGGLIVAPSAPGLAVDLVSSASYRKALTSASMVMTDSGFMVLLWWLYTGERLPRHSGLKFLRGVLARPELKEPGAVFWVMPSKDEDVRNRTWLRSQGFVVGEEDTYIAPNYPIGPITDEALVARIEARRPRVVMLAIGGGVQERVGLMLRDRLGGNPSILCLGAAIAFLTGGQANIPPWADKLVLGWLLRLISNPRRFWRRYWDALALAPLLWHYREETPPLRVT